MGQAPSAQLAVARQHLVYLECNHALMDAAARDVRFSLATKPMRALLTRLGMSADRFHTALDVVDEGERARALLGVVAAMDAEVSERLRML